MSRAIEAGATPADLAGGDTVFKGAESLAAQNGWPEAMVQLATAASLWADAERQSRARAARDSQARRAAEQPAAPPPVVTPAPVDPRPDIQKVIDDYARALESRDVGQVRRGLPRLKSPQQQSWEGFFQSLKNLKGGLTVSAARLSRLTAQNSLTGVSPYDNATTGRSQNS